MSFTRRTGKCSYKTYPNTAVAIAAGAAVQFDEAGKVAIAATNKGVAGVAVAAAALSTTCTIDLIDPNSIWKATAITTTPAITDIGKRVDFASSSGVAVDVAVTTNDDFLVVGVDPGETGFVQVTFNNLGFGLTDVGAE